MAEKKEMHLICNAHIDPVWLWDWEEGAAAAVATFRSAASLAERYDYVFCHNEALLYEWAEEYEPALFERVKRLVKAGKWHIAGGWYLQPDCNLPSGESFIRQAMVGRAYFAEKFGAERLPKTAVNFDPFGHSLGLPQILKKCGYENYLFMRPFPGEGQGVPDRPFVWRGPDGSEVKAAAGGAYNTPLGKLRDRVEADYGKLERGEGAQVYNGGGLVVSCWGVGNHGGGPSAADLDYITGEIANGARAEIIHSTPDLLFSRLKTETVYEKSLNIAMPGCYTSAVRIKQKHRELESRLYSTEKMLAAAALNGLSEYPETELREAEKDLLFCEFHDILPGSCVRKGEETALKRLSRGLCVLDELRARAFFALCSGLPKAEAGAYPIAVCNPHPYTVKTAADCGFMLADQQWDESFWTGAEVYDGDKRLPSQIVREAS
ncbi:MAG: alpha-mannosidase, partial [Clostridiales bacterium]|nr:alpha-mannosidase [Clostridiales bacterium]